MRVTVVPVAYTRLTVASSSPTMTTATWPFSTSSWRRTSTRYPSQMPMAFIESPRTMRAKYSAPPLRSVTV